MYLYSGESKRTGPAVWLEDEPVASEPAALGEELDVVPALHDAITQAPSVSAVLTKSLVGFLSRMAASIRQSGDSHGTNVLVHGPS